MKISEGIKLIGKPATILDCTRNDLVEFYQERGFKVGVEVGVYQGEYSEVMAKGGFKVYAVDPWGVYPDYKVQIDQAKIDYNYKVTKERLEVYPNVSIVRKTSMEAVKDFEDNSLDFVYIDANHRFKFIAEDMMEWAKKVKEGGVLAGHDYAFFRHRFPGGGCQVREIVDAFALSFDLNFWLLGGYHDKGRDRLRSWMFIKNWRNA